MKLNKLLLSFIALLSTLTVLFVPYRTALVFYDENTTNIEAFLPINTGDTFQIIFKHSIHLTDVVEKYRVTNNLEIEQYEFVYEEFGIGMPSNAEEGETFVYEDGKYHIRNMDNVFPSINVRNGKTVSEHRLIWGTEDNEEQHLVWFNEYFEPGAWFTVKVDRISLWEYMKGVKIHESK
ncbi:DUF1850 domain-containing protein [Oceanobacillus salinisoli]|uniref:DUF1850 domain-containing protein n=1 Tax=Oceanobacillus salinisoli TaxID=2678611 RepID=UPI0012E21796|nr:DUF1850 domain-containing protein [Oceanobacillus salinisoli]